MSWAYSEEPDTIIEVSQWPCREHKFRDEAQVPTQYDLGSKQWGYLVPRDAVPLRWFKLLLLEEKDVKEDLRDSEYLRDARRQLQRFDSDGVIDVIADFLRELWAHALEEIKVQIDIDLVRFRVALTVPAIWPQYAKQKMKEAAKRAASWLRGRLARRRWCWLRSPRRRRWQRCWRGRSSQRLRQV